MIRWRAAAAECAARPVRSASMAPARILRAILPAERARPAVRAARARAARARRARPVRRAADRLAPTRRPTTRTAAGAATRARPGRCARAAPAPPTCPALRPAGKASSAWRAPVGAARAPRARADRSAAAVSASARPTTRRTAAAAASRALRARAAAARPASIPRRASRTAARADVRAIPVSQTVVWEAAARVAAATSAGPPRRALACRRPRSSVPLGVVADSASDTRACCRGAKEAFVGSAESRRCDGVWDRRPERLPHRCGSARYRPRRTSSRRPWPRFGRPMWVGSGHPPWRARRTKSELRPRRPGSRRHRIRVPFSAQSSGDSGRRTFPTRRSLGLGAAPA